MNLNHKAGESVESRLARIEKTHWDRMNAMVAVSERLEDEWRDRLAALEKRMELLGDILKEHFPVQVLKTTGDKLSKPPVPPSECEANAFDNDGNPIQIRLSGGPAPSDEPKLPKLPKNWGKIKTPDGRIVDFETMKEDEPELTTNNSQVTNKSEPKFNCVVCPECGLIGNYCEDKTRISISRKVAEEWVRLVWNVRNPIDPTARMANEVKLALSKEGK